MNGKIVDDEVSLTCRCEFSAAHRYRVKEWSDEENRLAFGDAANPKGHGHNYAVEVTLSGKVDPKTGMVINIKELKKLLKEVVEDLDHRNLNEEVPYFQSRLPTTENLSLYFFENMKQKIPRGKVTRVRVYENESLYAECRN